MRSLTRRSKRPLRRRAKGRTRQRQRQSLPAKQDPVGLRGIEDALAHEVREIEAAQKLLLAARGATRAADGAVAEDQRSRAVQRGSWFSRATAPLRFSSMGRVMGAATSSVGALLFSPRGAIG